MNEKVLFHLLVLVKIDTSFLLELLMLLEIKHGSGGQASLVGLTFVLVHEETSLVQDCGFSIGLLLTVLLLNHLRNTDLMLLVKFVLNLGLAVGCEVSVPLWVNRKVTEAVQ